VAVAPFGVAFGVACRRAGLSTWDALGFSTLVFTGSAQFAAVSVLDDGGSVVAAVAAGLLLNLRSLAFGIALAPALDGPRWERALWSQLMIDESAAVASAQAERRWRRTGDLTAGLGVFEVWNATTVRRVDPVGHGLPGGHARHRRHHPGRLPGARVAAPRRRPHPRRGRARRPHRLAARARGAGGDPDRGRRGGRRRRAAHAAIACRSSWSSCWPARRRPRPGR
jgi:hypothetical protein